LLKSIESSTDEMARLMERVGFIVKATARPSALEPVDMGWAFASAEDRLGRRIQERRASVAQPPSWPTVMGVALWLEAIWSDLLGNAVDHGGDGVRVEAGWGQDEGMYRFWVQDTGPGVPAGQVPGLFHPFHRLHEPDAPTGLGLAMVERLVDLQKGRCAYEAAPGGGACFSFTLPVPL
jgi:signal transduction histidine kinase